jgi:hypothetical protein
VGWTGNGKLPTGRWARRGWGDLIGPNPTDRGKRGVKRSLLVEAAGEPLAVVIAGANIHDTKLLAATLDAVVVERPQPTAEQPQHLCLDKAYDNPTGEAAVTAVRLRGAHPPHRRGEAVPSDWRAAFSRAPLDGGADTGVALDVSRPAHPLRQAERELPGAAPVRLRASLVSPPAAPSPFAIVTSCPRTLGE